MVIGIIPADNTDGVRDIGVHQEEVVYGSPVHGNKEIMVGIGGVGTGSRLK